jgi:hypothetical protein
MTWRDFIRTNWKNVILTSLLFILVPNIIEFLGSLGERENAIQNFNFLSIEFGGPPLWVSLLSNISLIIISIAFTFYFLKKDVNYKDTFKIIFISAILFSVAEFTRQSILAPGGAATYLSSFITSLFYDFIRGTYDILVIISRLVYTSLFYILIPSAIVIGIFKFRKKK